MARGQEANDRRRRQQDQIPDDGRYPGQGHETGARPPAILARPGVSLPPSRQGPTRKARSGAAKIRSRDLCPRLLLASALGLSIRQHAFDEIGVLVSEVRGKFGAGYFGPARAPGGRMASGGGVGVRTSDRAGCYCSQHCGWQLAARHRRRAGNALMCLSRGLDREIRRCACYDSKITIEIKR